MTWLELGKKDYRREGFVSAFHAGFCIVRRLNLHHRHVLPAQSQISHDCRYTDTAKASRYANSIKGRKMRLLLAGGLLAAGIAVF
ncbi:MAG: hypothetical protein KDJ69_16225, partial [Nitratireductor sp.]|nr:hypothetical protein [Nitratireductor sp.]